MVLEGAKAGASRRAQGIERDGDFHRKLLECGSKSPGCNTTSTESAHVCQYLVGPLVPTSSPGRSHPGLCRAEGGSQVPLLHLHGSSRLQVSHLPPHSPSARPHLHAAVRLLIPRQGQSLESLETAAHSQRLRNCFRTKRAAEPAEKPTVTGAWGRLVGGWPGRPEGQGTSSQPVTAEAPPPFLPFLPSKSGLVAQGVRDGFKRKIFHFFPG